jgi:hypothetical protein
MRLPFVVSVSGILQGLQHSLGDRQHVDLNQRLIRPRVPKALPLLEAVEPTWRDRVLQCVWVFPDAIPHSLLNSHTKGRFDIPGVKGGWLTERLSNPSERC